MVGRPRAWAVLFSGTLVAVGVAAIADEDLGVVPGLCLAVPGLIMLVLVLPAGACVDGAWLFARDVRGWGRPVRLDALTSGYVDDGPDGRTHVVLRDSRGVMVRMPPMVVGLSRLYRLLGDRDVVGGDVVFDDALTDHIDRNRPRGRPPVARPGTVLPAGGGPGAGPLPSRPDPATGLPTPPPGPDLSPHLSRHAGDDRRAAREVDAAPGPRPPRGRGPALSWRRHGMRGRLAAVLVAFAVLAVGIAASRGLEWTVDPAAWLVVAVFTVPLAGAVLDRDIAAGADWARRGRTWVDLYTLIEIRAASSDGKLRMTLTDARRRRVRLSADELAEVPGVWALVHNGMRHGAATGAQLSGDGVYGLGLGSPSPSAFPAGPPPRRGPGRWALGVLLMTVSVLSTVVLLALGSDQAWTGDEDLDFGIATALCVVVQLSICSVAVGVGNVVMEGAIVGIAVVIVLVGLWVAPLTFVVAAFDDRGTGAALGSAAGVAVIAAVVWLANRRARLLYLLRRAAGRAR